MLELLNNPWVSWIWGWIISWLIVYFLTKILLEKWQNKEYNQRLKTANNEILHAIRPLIAQKKIPSKSIINSLMDSIESKFEVSKKDLVSVDFIKNELIREVLENIFLDPTQKIDFCSKISELNWQIHNIDSKVINWKYFNYRKSSNIVSIFLWTYVTIFAATLTIYLWNIKRVDMPNLNFDPFFITIFPSLLAFILMFFLKNTKDSKIFKEVSDKINWDADKVKNKFDTFFK